MKKIPYILRAALAIIAGISLVILGSVLTRGGETWQSCMGIILLLIALRMIFPTRERSLREEVREEPFVVPLAVPYTLNRMCRMSPSATT